MFRIGEFSKFTQIPGSALRYYADIGLFQPQCVDQTTGYRYYSANQIPELNKIIALKELGLSLDQIRDIISQNLDIKEYQGMLTLRRAEIEQNIAAENARLAHIEARISQLDNDDPSNDFDIATKTLAKQHILSIREKITSFDVAQKIILSMFKGVTSKLGRSKIGPLIAILHSDCFDVEDIDIEIGLTILDAHIEPIQIDLERTVTVTELPAYELAVCSTRVGTPATSFCCRQAIAKWIENNSYEIVGPGREVFIVPPLPGKEEQTVMEFQYPIRQRAEA